MTISTFSGTGFDIESYDTAFNEYQITNVPLSIKPKINVSWLSNGSYTLLERQNNVDMLQHGRCTNDEFIISLPSYNKESFQAFLQHKEGINQGFIVPPNEECYWLFQEGMKHNNFSIKVDELKHHLTDSELGEFIEKSTLNKRVDVPTEQLKRVSYAATKLLQQDNNQTLAGTLVISQLEELAMQALLLPKLEVIKRRNNSKTIFFNAIDFIRTNYTRKIFISEVAIAANTTVRNLQYLFNSELAMSPLKYLALFRLYKFHCILKYSRSISEAAVMCGLTHMGRASADYKNTFGVTPTSRLSSNNIKQILSWKKDKKLLKYLL